ncbi:B-cell lymphoma 3 protein [Hippocampus comes]|uniref:B-cell lymphoma 3 protein n=1 Tax=Hippocampus comes TaxID=109280 RepID=UPI00094ED6EB|nr:PREDICTED: B-cell lymphoma 3 protein-like [Hippocampus comes]XP_019751661.1 PREDICTED: B-cell lymphoma 3 protein-like [Hippocampus comes]
MPTVMTMNGDGRSLAAAPLDLSTGQRGNTSSAAEPECGTCRKETVRSPAPTPPHTCGTFAAAPGCLRKKPADKASLRLPFRKRPITVEPEERASGEAGPARCLSRTGEAADPPPRTRTAEGRLAVARVTRTHSDEAPRTFEVRPVHAVPPLTYGHYSMYVYPELGHLGFHHTQYLLTSVALATRQDEDGDTALHIAVVKGELAIVRQLVHLLQRAGKSLDIYNNLRQTPLHLAVITQQANMVEALLRAGSDPSALDRNGQTALHLCCEYDHPACLSVVLSLPSSAACLEMKNFQGLSPLHVTVLHGHRDLAAMLLAAGADVNTMDIKSGQSPLILAVESNNAEMVRFLIESGCDVNRPSYSSNTALHSACARGQADVVRALLKSGADSSLKNYHNDTPVMLAKNKKIADILRGRGSKPIRIPDQRDDMSASPHGSNLMSIGSPSPSHSGECSPSMAPPILPSAAPHSPRTAPMLAFPFY